jgi:hypothetical protein
MVSRSTKKQLKSYEKSGSILQETIMVSPNFQKKNRLYKNVSLQYYLECQNCSILQWTARNGSPLGRATEFNKISWNFNLCLGILLNFKTFKRVLKIFLKVFLSVINL